MESFGTLSLNWSARGWPPARCAQAVVAHLEQVLALLPCFAPWLEWLDATDQPGEPLQVDAGELQRRMVAEAADEEGSARVKAEMGLWFSTWAKSAEGPIKTSINAGSVGSRLPSHANVSDGRPHAPLAAPPLDRRLLEALVPIWQPEIGSVGPSAFRVDATLHPRGEYHVGRVTYLANSLGPLPPLPDFDVEPVGDLGHIITTVDEAIDHTDREHRNRVFDLRERLRPGGFLRIHR
jgi:hypothetical protein